MEEKSPKSAEEERGILHRLFRHEIRATISALTIAALIIAILLYVQLRESRQGVPETRTPAEEAARQYFKQVEAIHGMSGTVTQINLSGQRIVFLAKTPLDDEPTARTAIITPVTTFDYTEFVRNAAGQVIAVQKPEATLKDIKNGYVIVVSSDADMRFANEFIATNIQALIPLEQ